MSYSRGVVCPICGAVTGPNESLLAGIEGQHRCKPSVLRAIDEQLASDPEDRKPRQPSEAERLYRGLKEMEKYE